MKELLKLVDFYDTTSWKIYVKNAPTYRQWPKESPFLDQHNVRQKIEQWKVTDPESTHFFRPYHVKDGDEDSDSCSPPTSMAMTVEMRIKR